MGAHELKDDKEVFEAIARKISEITGVQLGAKQSSLVFSRLSKHLRNRGGISALEYWNFFCKHEEEEIPVLISLLTTHHTFFFREAIHFEYLENDLPRLIQAIKASGRNTVKVWCAACSYGHEGYTIAMFLDYHLHQLGSNLQFHITFSDVDQESVRIAGNGIYRNDELSRVPINYRSNHWSRGTGKVGEYSKIKARIASQCEFKVINLLDLDRRAQREKDTYDIIFVRNVFIYFTSAEIERISNNLVKHLEPHGLLFIGVSESLMGLNVPLDHIGKSIYRLHGETGETASGHSKAPNATQKSSTRRSRVPVPPPKPPNSPIEAPHELRASHTFERLDKRVVTLQRTMQIGFHVRQLINTLPGFKSSGFEVVASADEALGKVQQKHADILVVEAGMLPFLPHIFNQRIIPTLIVPNSQAPHELLPWTHVRWLEMDLRQDVPGQKEALTRALDLLSHTETPRSNALSPTPVANLDTSSVIVIGASTGGTEALSKLIMDLPPNMPPIVIVQHIPEGFSRAFAERLDQISHLQVKEAVDGDLLQVGRVLVAPGDRQLSIIGRPGNYRVHIYAGEKVNGHRPSVDVLFRSAAENIKSRMLGVILTGMGSDGADGLLQMRKAGAITLGQDAASSVVYGMPRVAHQVGAVSKVLPLQQMASEILKILTVKS